MVSIISVRAFAADPERSEHDIDELVYSLRLERSEWCGSGSGLRGLLLIPGTSLMMSGGKAGVLM